ncbi:hypothetical protein TrVE_jg7490 [Triparma verrucosa]|uniref:RanBP2-type domain-containing protein n=1 Tax=Triparma verrucosa TaxID=1606542 RepID=A0A9W7C733_9STRA|nr:hypothetical protein TrVE_jg7490 [Triparma verrucosa]
MFGPSSTPVDVENASNFPTNARNLEKNALTPSKPGSVKGNSFGSPGRRKPLHDAEPKTPEHNVVSGRVTRSSSKKARTTPSSPSSLPPRRNSLTAALPVNTPVIVTSGVHKSKTGSITTVSHSTYRVTFSDGTLSGNIPKASISKSSEGDASQRKIMEYNFEAEVVGGNNADPTPKKRRRGQDVEEADHVNRDILSEDVGRDKDKDNSSVTFTENVNIPKSIFKSPAKIYSQRVNGSGQSSASSRSGVRVNLYDPTPGPTSDTDVSNDFSGLNIWDASHGSLNVKVQAKISEWKNKYVVRTNPSEGVQDDEITEPLKKKGIDTSCAASNWPHSSDIFSGNFSTINPRTSKNINDEDEVKADKPNCWRCVMCLEENVIEKVNCGVCRRLRGRHNDAT